MFKKMKTLCTLTFLTMGFLSIVSCGSKSETNPDNSSKVGKYNPLCSMPGSSASFPDCQKTTKGPPSTAAPQQSTTPQSSSDTRAIRRIDIDSNCPFDVWITPLSDNGAPLQEGVMRVRQGGRTAYSIPDQGWKGQFRPKTNCDNNGQNCDQQSLSPCPTGRPCTAPGETKVEFFFPPIGDSRTSYYDVSLVDGYTLPARITPQTNHQGSCVSTLCAVQYNECPTNENSVGDLRVFLGDRIIQCLSPCKKWVTARDAGGLGGSENVEPGLHYCCPNNNEVKVSAEECQRGPVVNTQYVNLIHRVCPTAYSYAFDDVMIVPVAPVTLSPFVHNVSFRIQLEFQN